MPRGLTHQLDGVCEDLSRIEGLLDSAGDGAPHYGLLMQRSRQAREDIKKVMSSVRRIKAKVAGGKLKAKPGTAAGVRAKVQVYKGRQDQTTGGYKKADLHKNKKGKVVSKKASVAGKHKYEHIQKWTQAIQTAKSELSIVGFCPVGGRTKRGQRLYSKAREVLRRDA